MGGGRLENHISDEQHECDDVLQANERRVYLEF
jgi:hypothetical protein